MCNWIISEIEAHLKAIVKCAPITNNYVRIGSSPQVSSRPQRSSKINVILILFKISQKFEILGLCKNLTLAVSLG